MEQPETYHEINPSVISPEAVEGIKEFFQYETGMKTGRGVEKGVKSTQNDAIKEFDWLTLAIIPNLEKSRIQKPTLVLVMDHHCQSSYCC